MYPTIITFLALFLKDIKPVIIIPMVGKIFLILGPSGSGKGTVMAYLHQEFKDAVFPISCTTRSPRPGEHDGDVYYFLNRDEFQKKIDAGEFLEWAKVHNDNMYGTLKKPILDALAAGKIVIREVDMQGVESIVKLLPRDQVVSILLQRRRGKIYAREF